MKLGPGIISLIDCSNYVDPILRSSFFAYSPHRLSNNKEKTFLYICFTLICISDPTPAQGFRFLLAEGTTMF
jgi:hypothetical protein